MMMDGYKAALEFTSDDEWNAVKPLVQKVTEAQREVRANAFAGMGRMMFGGGRRGVAHALEGWVRDRILSACHGAVAGPMSPVSRSMVRLPESGWLRSLTPFR